MVDVAMLRDQSRAVSVDTVRRNHWGLLMTQVRDQLHSATASEFSSRAFELLRLALGCRYPRPQLWRSARPRSRSGLPGLRDGILHADLTDEVI